VTGPAVEPGPGRRAWERAVVGLLGHDRPPTLAEDEILRRAVGMLRAGTYRDAGVPVSGEDRRWQLGAEYIERALAALGRKDREDEAR
jgi:hypothetical protein